MSDSVLDQPRKVRDEDRLDAERVAAWASDALGTSGLPTQEQFRGGASNLTYLLRWPDRAVVLRTAPAGVKARGAHDMGREVRVLRALSGKVPVPQVLGHCTDDSVIGREFYVMERLEGIILRGDLPGTMALAESQAGALCEAMLDAWAGLHQLDLASVGLGDLGRGPGYVARQVSGWTRRYEKARTPDAPAFAEVMDWLAAHQPEDVATCLIHNDWRFDNLVLDPTDPTRIIGVLDWEMATRGDPLMDLGSALAYWVEAEDEAVMQLMRRQPTHLPGMMRRDEVVAAYLERSGHTLDDFLFYEVFGLFRLAVILQQIWYRFTAGQTSNPSFSAFGHMVIYLEGRCRRRLEAAG